MGGAPVRPQFSYEPRGGRQGAPALVIAQDERLGLNGCWRKAFAVTPGAPYRISAWCRTQNVPAARCSAVVGIVWQDSQGRTVPTDMGSVEVEMPARRLTGADGWTEVSDRIAFRNGRHAR